MKIIYKLFLFGILLRVTPPVIESMGIFPSTTLASLRYTMTNTDVWGAIMNIVSPVPVGTDVPGMGMIQLTTTLIVGAFVAVGAISALRVNGFPGIIAGISAALIFPFIVNTGLVFYYEVGGFGSPPAQTLIIAIIVGICALAFITLLELPVGGKVDDD